MKNVKNRIFWGLLSGIIGGLAGAMVLWGSWLLPALGLLLSRADIINGAAALLVFGAVGGILYALILGDRGLRLATTILTGLLLGVVFWVIGGLLLIPLMLGFPPQLSNPLDHWTPLLAFSIYGVIVSLLYSRWALRQPVLRSYLALGLLLFSIVLTPLMLRAAVSTEPEALDLPEGYKAEVVAKGFTYPTSLCMDEKDNVYVAEAGYAYGPKTTLARILMVRNNGGIEEIARDFEGPINGLTMQKNKLYISHRGKITEVDLESKERKDLIKNLPSLGDHQNNDLLFGKDGLLYFGQGTATNAGVVGPDNFVYAWADRFPDFHDSPSRTFILTGENYEAQDLSLPGSTGTKTTGAFAPFGEKREQGEKVEKTVPANGVIHCLDPETKELSIHADGLRNPYGLTQDDDGNIYATNLGYDDRGVRAVKGSPDWIVKIKEGAWYGWPDYAGSIPLADGRFASERGVNLKPLIDNPLTVEPPLTELPAHYSPMKLDYAPEKFNLAGLFVAIFGDGQPLTGDLKEQVPTGVIRLDPESGDYEWFIKNKEKPRAGRLGDGFKRVTDLKFDREGRCLYVLDFGVMEFTDFSPNAIPRTGVLWKIKINEEPFRPEEKTPDKGNQEKEEKPLEVPKKGPVQPQPEIKEKPEEPPAEKPKPEPKPGKDHHQRPDNKDDLGKHPKPGDEEPVEPQNPETPEGEKPQVPNEKIPDETPGKAPDNGQGNSGNPETGGETKE